MLWLKVLLLRVLLMRTRRPEMQAHLHALPPLLMLFASEQILTTAHEHALRNIHQTL